MNWKKTEVFWAAWELDFSFAVLLSFSLSLHFVHLSPGFSLSGALSAETRGLSEFSQTTFAISRNGLCCLSLLHASPRRFSLDVAELQPELHDDRSIDNIRRYPFAHDSLFSILNLTIIFSILLCFTYLISSKYACRCVREHTLLYCG